MIAYLSGKITFKNPTHIFLETGGIGYMVKISLHTFERVRDLDTCRLHTSLVVKTENQSPLRASICMVFLKSGKKDLFERLISVSGVGATTARMMLSTYKPDEIITGDF